MAPFDDGRFSRVPPGRAFYQSPMPTPLDPRKSPALGTRKPLPTTPPVGGTVNFDVNTTVTLLEVRGLEWGPWAITLDPMFPIASPWPQGELAMTGAPRVVVEWGVGGFRRRAEFDYPAGGTCFVLNSDNIDIGVRPTAAQNHAVGVQPQPTVGAWAVPGVAPGYPTPLILQEADGVTVAVVPAFARNLVVAPYISGGAPAAGITDVIFTDNTGLVIHAFYQHGYLVAPSGPKFFRVPVPPQATRVNITDTGATSWSVFWEISLA